MNSLEVKDFYAGPIVHSPIIISGYGDYQIGIARILKTLCNRKDFEDQYRRHTDFELLCEKGTSLIDILAIIGIHVSVNISRPTKKTQVLGDDCCFQDFYEDQFVLPSHTVEQIEKSIRNCLFWGDEIGKFRVNFRDGNEKYVTAESDKYVYSVWIGTS